MVRRHLRSAVCRVQDVGFRCLTREFRYSSERPTGQSYQGLGQSCVSLVAGLHGTTRDLARAVFLVAGELAAGNPARASCCSI